MKFNLIIGSLIAAIMFIGCESNEYKSDLEDLAARVEVLEDAVSGIESDITTLESLVAALESNAYVTSVEEISGGYQINLSVGDPIKIYNGYDGSDGEDGSAVGIEKYSDDIYYWTIDGEYVLDSSNNKIPVFESSSTIGVGVYSDNGLYWTIDGEWLIYNGNMIPALVPNINMIDHGTYITIKVGGNSYDLKIVDAISIAFTSYEVVTLLGSSDTHLYTLDIDGLTEADFMALRVEIYDSLGNTSSELIISKGSAGSERWGIEITAPTFYTGAGIKNAATIEVAPAKSLPDNSEAVLKVILIDSKGCEYSTSVAIKYNQVFDDDNTPLSDDAEITSVAFEYRYIYDSGSGSSLGIITLDVDSDIDSENATIVCDITVPSVDGVSVTQEVWDDICLSSLSGYIAISTAASCSSYGNSPTLGVVSDWSGKTAQYTITSASGVEKLWTITIDDFIKE